MSDPIMPINNVSPSNFKIDQFLNMQGIDRHSNQHTGSNITQDEANQSACRQRPPQHIPAEIHTASIEGWDPGQISQQANPRGLEEEGGVHNARRTGLEEAGSFQEQLVEAW